MPPKRADDSDERLRRVTHGLVVPPLLASHAPLATTLADRMQLYRVPGISLAIIDEYEVQTAHAEGVLEAGGTVPVTTRTLFQGGSLAKPVVALAALRLVQEGVLDLEPDINTWLTSWKIPPNDGWQPRVTLRHLLSHTSGLTVPVYPGYPRDEAVPTLRQVLDGAGPSRTPPVRVNLIPGLQYRYSSGGFVVLQQLLMDVTGKPFADLMRELILEPLGMEDTTFEQPLPQPRWAVAARGHRNGGQPVQGGWFVYPETAQGGIWTTASDVGRVVVELQRARAGRPSRILST